MNKYNLTNKVAIVTGGAQGFGLAITKRIIQSGGKAVSYTHLTLPTSDLL